MSWIRSSRGVSIGILAVVLLATVGTATAVTVEFTDPEPAQVSESIEYSLTVQEPYRDAPDQWTLQGETGLENATWTIQASAQGDPVDTSDFAGESFTYDLNQEDDGATTIQVDVSGDVPAIESYSYEERSTENVSVMSIARVTDGNTAELQEIESHRYTEESRDARTAIDSAIEAVGDRNDKIDQAISSYDNSNFENAASLAEEAEGGAQSGQLLLYGAIAVVIIALVTGGVYYWRQRRDKGYKLQ